MTARNKTFKVLHVVATLYLFFLGIVLWAHPKISATCLLGASLMGVSLAQRRDET